MRHSCASKFDDTAALAMGGLALILISWKKWDFELAWNMSSSVPIGLYRIVHDRPVRGDIAAVRLSEAVASLAAERGYLPRTALLLKPVVASASDRVCRWGRLTVTSRRIRAISSVRDLQGRPMPQWRGCQTLAPGELFVMSSTKGSFDGRYFGPLKVDTIVGRAEALWTIKDR